MVLFVPSSQQRRRQSGFATQGVVTIHARTLVTTRERKASMKKSFIVAVHSLSGDYDRKLMTARYQPKRWVLEVTW